MRTAGRNGSRFSPRPDQSNDDVVCFGASERAKKRNDWLWSGKSPYFTLSFSFQLTFRSSLELGCWQTCAETSSKSSSAISQSSELKEMFERWMRWRKWTTFPALLVKQVIFLPMQRASLDHEGLVYNWKQRMCSNRSQLQQAAENVWVHLYEHFHV